MQGRLLPKYLGRYQAHPVNYWQKEFEIASEIGLDCIEFILDFNDVEKNPLMSSSGIKEINSLIKRTNVSVGTICADYFMEKPLHSNNELEAKNSLAILEYLIRISNEIELTDIVIPCVDQSSLNNELSQRIFIERISKILSVAESFDINLSLETDLNPVKFSELLAQLDSKNVTVNYDIGNSAALGFDPMEELSAYGDKISDIHIKDRVLSAGPVVLGEGDANFAAFFNKIKEYEYKGPFIMQAYRDDEGLQIFKQQLSWVKPYLERF
jgi:sugar phosphate isomerase/epimerase